MKEFIDKLISRLEELYNDNDKMKKKAYEEQDWENFELFTHGNEGVKESIEIVIELAEEYKAEHIVDLCNQFCNKADAILQKKNNGWISCGERLPEILQWVLIQTTQGDMDVVRYIGETECWGNDFYHRIHPRKVIAWQPLPAPFKEGE